MKSRLILTCITAALLSASVQAVELTNSQENKINKEKAKTIEIHAEVLNDNGETVSKTKMFVLDKEKAKIKAEKEESYIASISSDKRSDGKVETRITTGKLNNGFNMVITPTLLKNNKALVELTFTLKGVSTQDFVVSKPENEMKVIAQMLEDEDLISEDKEILKKAFFSKMEADSGGETVTIQMPSVSHRSLTSFFKVDLDKEEHINLKKVGLGENAPTLNLRLNVMK